MLGLYVRVGFTNLSTHYLSNFSVFRARHLVYKKRICIRIKLEINNKPRKELFSKIEFYEYYLRYLLLSNIWKKC